MVNGQMFDDRIICPLHTASFSVTTGQLKGAPGIDGLPTFDIIERDGKKFVQVPSTLPKNKTEHLAKRDPKDKRRYVIIGGGPAGLFCAESLRKA